MKNIRKIIVPVDFSQPAAQALEVAIALARKFTAELHLLHCYQLLVPSTLSFHSVEVPQSFDREVRGAARRILAECGRRVNAAGVSLHEHLEANLPSAATIELAEQIGADLIVMGTQGLSGLKHALLGSVAERTVRMAPCPVLTVGPATRRSTAAVHKILVPVDFSDHSRRALDEAIAFATSFGAEVHLLHCYQIHPEMLATYGIVMPEAFDRDLRRAAMQRLAEWHDKVNAAGCKVQEHLTAELPSRAIAEKADALDADLIVMGTRGLTGFKHALLGSVAERTIRTAKCPVLTVKDSEED